uniref:Methyltransferase-like protein 4 n=1 Tax=Anopheles atroparvus TaxID=41427 RepID=A0AAG5DV69_ANOAO
MMESVVEISENAFLLNHPHIVAQNYCNNFWDKSVRAAGLNNVLFDINAPYDHRNAPDVSSKKCKRMKTVGILDEVTQKVLQNHALLQTKLQTMDTLKETTNAKALEFVEHFNSATNYDGERCFRGQNASNCTVINEMDGETYLIPPSVKFINSSIDRFTEYVDEDEKFDLILLDPPWWNKYIRRVKAANYKSGYRMLTNEDIKEIPLERHLHPDTFVVVWCTNAPTHIDAITKDFFPKWGLELVGTWYWIKITKGGQPVCKFNEPNKKQPYERVFIGLPGGSSLAKSFPTERFLYSVPSAIHSHKPPLYDLFTKKFLALGATCLELFARSLHTGCTSYGMEVLKLQNKRLYELAMEDNMRVVAYNNK